MTTLADTDFSTLKLGADLLENLASLGYTTMMPIQAQSLPPILAGADVIAQAKTGSGKTAAFGLGILSRIDVSAFRVQALVLCPTRELADQVAREIRKLARATANLKVLTVCGGMPLGPQINSLSHGAHVVVGTPGRVEDLLRKGKLELTHTKILVLDEADRMLEMGFQPALDAIVEHVPTARQTLLFSATYPQQIEDIARRIMVTPQMVRVDLGHDNVTIQQFFYALGEDDNRTQALALLLRLHTPRSSVVFCATKRDAQTVAGALRQLGFSALDLHGDLEQRERDQTLVRFANGSVSTLVATDVAARGLDIDELGAVFNYHLSRDVEVHIHRVGRTGRAGGTGIACSLVAAKEQRKLDLLSEYLGQSIATRSLPSPNEVHGAPPEPTMVTVEIAGGRKDKLRPGDILGALTGERGVAGSDVGKINLFDRVAYVAVKLAIADRALAKLRSGKLKGRSFRARLLQA